jgi:ribosome-associated protein YbcJ (S4-like RNA binding protein)
VKGEGLAWVNDSAITRTLRLLRDGDALEVTGTRMRFLAKT